MATDAARRKRARKKREREAEAYSRLSQQGEEPPKSDNVDPRDASWLNLTSTHSSDLYIGSPNFTYSILKALASVPQVAALIQTRVNRVKTYADEQVTKFDPGWLVSLEDGTRPSKSETKQIVQATGMIKDAGGDWDPGGFSTFLDKTTRDTLILDQVNFEPLRNSFTGLPYGFLAVDPTTIRRKIPDEGIKDGRWDFKEVGYVQWISDEIRAEFGPRDLGWGIRRPRSDLHVYGHGHPELQEAIGLVTALVNSQLSNAANITTGLHGHVAYAVFTQMHPQRADAIKRTYEASMSGARNNKKVPWLFFGPNDKVTPLQTGHSNHDMEFASWINWLVKCVCALYCIDPAEIGFIFGNEEQRNQMNASDGSSRIRASNDKGLYPLLKSIASWINFWLIKPYWPKLKFSFVGYDAQAVKEQLAADLQALKGILSPDEIRSEWGWEPRGDIVSQYPLDPAYAPLIQAKLAEMQRPPLAPVQDVHAFMSGARLPRMAA